MTLCNVPVSSVIRITQLPVDEKSVPDLVKKKQLVEDDQGDDEFDEDSEGSLKKMSRHRVGC